MGRVGSSESKYVVRAGWDDVPHLSARVKRDLLLSTPPYLRDARTKGIPSLGAGAVYPIPWEEVSVEPFPIPKHWMRAYAMDVGWKRTAAMWGAKDPESGTIFCYSEHYVGQSLPAVHAEAIKARGGWMVGAIDPAARGRSQVDGEQLMAMYQEAGLNLVAAKSARHSVEAGLYEVWSGLQFGLIRFFTSLTATPAEYRLYRRDEKGKVVKDNDHLMDCVRYLRMTWDQIASVKPAMHLATPTAPPRGNSKAGY